MDSSLPVTQQEHPHKGNLILDAAAELLQKSIVKAQYNASLERCDQYRLDYEELLREFSYEFYELNPSSIKDESRDQYELLERDVRKRVKMRLLKYIGLLSGGFVGTFFIHPIINILYSTLTAVIIVTGILRESWMEESPQWYKCMRFFWLRFRYKRIARKIEKQKVQ